VETCKVAGCARAGCPGVDVARHFADCDDLFDHLDNETILEMVNELVKIRPRFEELHQKNEERKAYHRKHQMVKKMLAEAADKLLDGDERERLRELAAEQAAEREIGRRR
jgi:hypothetical protein